MTHSPSMFASNMAKGSSFSTRISAASSPSPKLEPESKRICSSSKTASPNNQSPKSKRSSRIATCFCLLLSEQKKFKILKRSSNPLKASNNIIRILCQFRTIAINLSTHLISLFAFLILQIWPNINSSKNI